MRAQELHGLDDAAHEAGEEIDAISQIKGEEVPNLRGWAGK